METKAATTDQARQALEAIANVPMSISLEHWSVLSGTILSALTGADAALSVQKQLVEAAEAMIANLIEGDFISLNRVEALRAAILAAKASS